MKRIKRISLLSVLSLLLLCGCDENVGSPGPDDTDDSHNVAEEATHIVVEAPDTPDYLGTGVWNLDLFSDSSIRYNNDLAIVAADMSEKCEEHSDDNIRKLLKDYGIYAVEAYNYGGDSAFVIGQDTFTKRGHDTTVLVIIARGTMNILTEGTGDLFKGFVFDKEHIFLDEFVYDNVYDFEELIWAGFEEYVNKYPAILENERSDLKVLVTGHSLGGAAANLIGARLTNGLGDCEWWNRDIKMEDIYVYTFGAIKEFTYEDMMCSGYENSHNIYNYYDSYGPNGNQAWRNVSSPYAKFGHTEFFSIKENEFWDLSWNSHSMSVYKKALEYQRENGDFIVLGCEQDYSQEEGNNAVNKADYLDWKNAYREFYDNYSYMSMIASDLEWIDYDEENFRFGLRDLDNNGVPELIMFDGSRDMAGGGSFVFTYLDGQIKYLGMIGSRECLLYYIPNTDYPGLFCFTGNTGYYLCEYYTILDGEIKTEEVMESVEENEYAIEDITLIDKQLTEDDNLFRIHNDYDNYPHCDLRMYSRNRIYAIGWDAFAQLYGYGHSTGIHTDEEFVQMARNYYISYESTNGYVPSIIEVDSEDENGMVSIHLYDVVENHTATANWYTVDRFTAQGYDALENPIDLNEGWSN